MGFMDKIHNMPAKKVHTYLKVANVINGLLLFLSGILSISSLLTFSLPTLLSGIYVMLFSILLCCFECHLKKFDSYVFTNFGFMFYWQGRTVFFFFVATLTFGLGVLGIIVGTLTLVNVILNCYILYSHPGYKKFILEQLQLHQQGAVAREMLTIGPTSDGPSDFDNAMSIAGVLSGQKAGTAQDARNVVNFYKDNKEEVNKAGQFYKDNKEEVNAVAKVAYENKDTLKAAHDAFN